MASIKLLTWNVRGLGNKVKRSAVFSFLKKQRADIVVLVETHVEGRLQMALRRPWIGWAYHSSHSSHARGVSVLIAKTVHFELCDVQSDPQGRYVFLSVKLYGEPFLLMAFYVPPPFSSTIVTEGLLYMTRHPSIQAVWLGDFDATLNPTLDKLSPSPLPTTAPTHTRFSRLISSFNLTDTWRFKFPLTQAYSCFSATHNTMSRIDFIFISNTLAPRLLGAEFAPRLLSDHSPYWISLSVPLDRPPRTWRLNPFWLTLLSEDDELDNSWRTYFSENDGSASPDIVWEAFKLHARMTLTSCINRLKANSSAALDGAMQGLSSSEQGYVANPSPAGAAQLRLQTRVVNQLQHETARKNLFFCQTKAV